METKSSHQPKFPDRFPELPLRLANLPEFPNFFMIRDDLLPLGFGTKWRKAIGIQENAKEKAVKEILLWGAVHGNYLASFSTIFRSLGFFVTTIGYSKDPHLKTYNEHLVKYHSHSFHCYANRKLALEAFAQMSSRFAGLVLPEFGVHPNQILGLKQLWSNLETKIQSLLKDSEYKTSPNESQAILLLEIGSGVSFLSAYDYFRNSQVLVQGVMIGEKKDSWLSRTKQLQMKLGLQPVPIPEENVMEVEGKLPSSSLTIGETERNQKENPYQEAQKGMGFGKGQNHYKDWIFEFYQKNEIILEPMYSAKTLFHFHKKQNERMVYVSKIPIFYLHQGGQIQHLDLVFPKTRVLP